MDAVADSSGLLRFQPVLSRRYTNLDADTLQARLSGKNGTAYCYVLDSARFEDGRLVHIGTGPNFAGGLITLCTCKHEMRTYLDPEEWVGMWVAGYSDAKAGPARGHLVYLMRVRTAYESYRELWEALDEPGREAKAADTNPLGDLYRPRNLSGDPYKPALYVTPRKDHDHARNNQWHKDVGHLNRHGRRPALLVGDPKYSFVWDKPILAAPFELGWGSTKVELQELVVPSPLS